MNLLFFLKVRKSIDTVSIRKLKEFLNFFLLKNLVINNPSKLHFTHEVDKILVFCISPKYKFLYEDFFSGNFCFIVLQQLHKILLNKYSYSLNIF